MKVLLSLLSLWLLLLLQGCYSFSSTTLPAHIHTIRVPEIENQSANPALGVRVREAVLETLRRNASGITIVNNDAPADAELRLSLTNYTNELGSYTANSTVETYKSVITVNMNFMDLTQKKPIYEANGLRSEGTYSQQLNESEELHGQQRAIEKLQDLIVNNALSQW